MNSTDLKQRTKNFAKRVLKVVDEILEERLVKPLLEEANELVAIMTTSRKTACKGRTR